MEEPQNQQSKPKDDQRRASVRRRNPANVARPRRWSQLSPRCVLIRNLPRGFANWSDLAYKNQPIHVRRMVYCEDSLGSIMVEFASGADRNKILALDQQRRRRTRTHTEDQAPHDGRDAFEIKVRIERCTSEGFVKRVLSEASGNGNSSALSPLLTGVVTNSTTPPPSKSSSTPLVDRCIVIRKICNIDEEEEDYEIAEAPEYDRKTMRWDDVSIKSGSSNNLQQQSPPQQQRQPRAMEIRSGEMSGVVVRGAVLRSKSKMVPAMLIELESKESVERIFLADGDSKDVNHGASATTLAIPIEVHPVKSERYARFCFTNVKAILGSNHQVRRSSSTTDGANAENHNGNKTQITDIDKSIDGKGNREKMNGQVGEESGDDDNDKGEEHDDNNKEDNLLEPDKKIQDLEMEIRSLRADVSRWKSRATKSKVRDSRVDNGNHDEDHMESEVRGQREQDLKKEIRDLKANVGRWKIRANKAKDQLLRFRSNTDGKNGNRQMEGLTTDLSDDESQKSLSTSENPTQVDISEEQNRQGALLEERRKRESLEVRVRALLAENSLLKTLRATELSSEDSNKATETSKPQPTEGSNPCVEELSAENDRLKARVTEIERLETELEDSRAQKEQIEEARTKLEEENSGLLRYVLELEGHRNGKALAEEERFKELEKKNSDLETLHRFVKAQSEKSATDLQEAIEVRDAAVAEMQSFKSVWQTRMDTLRHLETAKSGGEEKGCIDCEIIEFYASLEECMTDDSVDDEAESGENNPATSSKNGCCGNIAQSTIVVDVPSEKD